MQPNSKIFCNVPWAKLHITSTGDYKLCCVMKTKSSDTSIHNISPIEWFHSDNANSIRKKMFDSQPLDECEKCYYNEKFGYESGRIRDNYKSIIFPDKNFNRSYDQSPWFDIFEYSKINEGKTNNNPVDYLVSLGNECNLACKMCAPQWSSQISSRYKSWNILPKHLNVRNNWTSNTESWNKFLAAIQSTPNLERLTFLGGETLINKKFFEIIDFLLYHNMTNITLSFITNATMYNQSLVDKLKKFKNLYIEFSIESIEKNNHYIRQGSDTEQVIKNILKFKSELAHISNFTISSAPQALSINTYDKLILWALENQLPIQGHPVVNPAYFNINVLPKSIRMALLPKFYTLKEKLLTTANTPSISFGPNPDKINDLLINETQSMINFLECNEPADVKMLQKEMISWLEQWDREFNLDAIDYYPEYASWFKEMNYHV
jgi:organic radical activating enzyme